VSTQYDLERGYLKLPELFVRNNTPNTITFNSGLVRWELGPRGNRDDRGPLPWSVAVSPGFNNVWDDGGVTVATDEEFNLVIDVLPVPGENSGGSGGGVHIHRQETPQSVVDIEHGFARPGPVSVTIFSLDKQIEYWNFTTDLVTDNVCRVTFDDPTSFIATVN